MGSKRRSKLGSSKKKKTQKRKKSKNEKEKDQTFLELPSDLLQLVISRLPLKDNIVASVVCKTWHKACVSLRVVDPSPWLIYFSKTDESYELYDPSMQKTYILQFPDLSWFRVCYSKDGWLLMYNANTYQLLFFNPFTRDRIPVPPLWNAYDQITAFSCAPTSTSCVLFTVSYVTRNYITVKTCCVNAKEWNTYVFKNRLPRNFNTFEKIVFSNGVFYCLTNTGCLATFDPSLNSWNILPGRPLKRPGSNVCFMTEHQGDIFLIYMYRHMNPTVLKLDITSFTWTERKTLGGLTIYASGLSSESRAEQQKTSGIRNCLCLSVFHGFKRTCIWYKVDGESKNCLKWKKQNPYENIWIMPPQNLIELPFL
uniref:F-box protein At3g56470-like n=1 Tax=Camelina sativa TaxID=90675 RepID=A0ABM0TJV8_CAMSA|nr:PREDICTED: F-box protein At3g56470-like [Camelina sativa]